MKKPKFVWEFNLIEENTGLQIDLNGGMSRTIWLEHPQASQFIAEQLAEVLRWQFDVGTKTEAYNVQTLFHALTIARRNLEKYKDWQDVMDEANEKRKKQLQGEN
jgi:hypothetical protein